MSTAQINRLLRNGFSVQQLKDSGRYMLVRGERVILESPDSIGIGWTVSSQIGTLRMPLRAAIKLALA
jgi:hypothetical protein